MMRFPLLCFFVLLASLLNAQKIYFVYLQTETGEPFFVRMNDKLYSSESSGYLILPKLKDSTYKFKLGFPAKDVDLDFTTTINKKDHGYLIKNLGDKGWGLFDLQSLDLQMSASNVKKESGFNNTSTNTQVNAFTALLAKATDDPSLRQNAVFAKQVEKKPEVVRTIEKEEKKPVVTDAVVKEVQNDSPKESSGTFEEKKPKQVMQPATRSDENKTNAVNTNDQKEDSQKSSVVQSDIYKRSEVIKLSEGSNADGFESVYIDQNPDGAKDTIRVFIPSGKTSVAIKEELKSDSTAEIKKTDAPDTAQAVSKTKKWWQISIGKNKTETAAKQEPNNNSEAETKTLNVSTDSSQAVTGAKEEPKKEEAKKWWQIAIGKDKTETGENKKCQVVANNDDFLKLRRKMAARTNDDGMLDEAKKYFKSKCFATEQIKNLSTMFLSSAGKFNFFNAAYNYTTDVENFSSLQSELKDEYYVNRFKEMVK